MFPVGQHEFHVNYGLVDADGDTGAQQWTLGYNYNITKTTKVYAFYTMVDNDNNGNFVMGGSTSTVLGATGAHFLQTRLPPDRFDVYQQAVQYQFYQALGLIVIAALTHVFPASRATRVAGWLVMAGIALFSGSIYATTAGAPRSIAIIAMFGGFAFQIAWWTLAVVALRGKN